MKFSMSLQPRRVSVVLAALVYAASFGSLAAEEQPQRELLVCADRDNLPFSNEQQQGFENKIAQLVADDLHATLRYTWNPQPRGFRPRMLGSGACDAVMGVPEGLPGVAVTRPYYTSSYVFVTARKRELALRGFDDPRLRQLKIGAEAIGAEGFNTPPVRALARRGITGNIVGYTVWQAAEPHSRSRMVEAVVNGDIDVALLWGPFAGYYAKAYREQVELNPAGPDPQQPALAFRYAISLGVRRGDDVLLARLQDVLERRQARIEAVLKDFGIPLVEQASKNGARTTADQSLLKQEH